MRGKGKDKCGGKGKGGNDASDEKGSETPNGTETSNGKGEGKSKGKSYLKWAWARLLEEEAFVEIERLRLEAEERAWARARADWLRSMNPWRWILMD